MQSPRLPRLLLVLALGLPLALPPATAHEGPEHEIEELTARLETEGEDADLLADRAIELALVGRTSEAMADLRRALQLAPDNPFAARELARLLLAGGQLEAADEVATMAIRRKAGRSEDQAGLLLLRAEVRLARTHLRPALVDAEAAIRRHPANPEWYLLRSEIQRRLGMARARCQGLSEGMQATGAAILGIEQLEALLDAARFKTALPLIEAELAASRIQTRWLIRRARALKGLGRAEEADLDLTQALRELAPRLQAPHPDPGLVLEEALARGLGGDPQGAEAGLARARQLGCDPTAALRVEAAMALAPVRPTTRERLDPAAYATH